MEIRACPKCGSKKIEMGQMGDGTLYGISSWKSSCKECGYQGSPLIFDNEKDYKDFKEGQAKEEKDIHACPKCGSRNLSMATIHDGRDPKYYWRKVCKECSWQGTPIILNSEKDYEKFLEGLSKDQKEKKTSNEKNLKDETYEMTEKEKEIYDFLDEPEKKKTFKEKKPYGLIILVFITLIYAVGITSQLFSIPLLILEGELYQQLIVSLYLLAIVLVTILIIYGFISRKRWTYSLAGTLFILGIPIGLFFLFYLTRPHVKNYFKVTGEVYIHP